MHNANHPSTAESSDDALFRQRSRLRFWFMIGGNALAVEIDSTVLPTHAKNITVISNTPLFNDYVSYIYRM